MKYLALWTLLIVVACTAPRSADTAVAAASQTSPYAPRIAAATERLSTSDPARKVLRAINAMGGLEKWYGNGDLAYQFDYKPLDGSTPRNTYVTNDYRRARAVHQLGDDPNGRFGFDGKEAWSMTPYYFVGLLFVLADEGINFTALPTVTMNGTAYNMVKVTFDEGTGDASGDYYLLYFHPTSGQLDDRRYVVTYPGYFPNGGSTPEKLMKFSGKTTVDGVTLPTGYSTYMWNNGEVSEPVTEITVSDYAFKTDLADDFFDMPAGAKVYNDLPE